MINQAVETITRALEEESIIYAHWKSNLRIDYALRGVDDLDLLINEEDYDRFVAVLKRNNFHLVRSFSDNWQTGIIHFLGLSISEIKIIHIHLHFKLPIGYDFNKNFYVKNISSILSRRRVYSSIYLTSQEDEYILLILRIILKSSITAQLLRNPKKTLRILFFNSNEFIPNNIRKEFNDLNSGVNDEKVKEIIDNDYSFICSDVFFSLRDKIVENNYLAILQGYSLFRRHVHVEKMLARINSFGKSSLRLMISRFSLAAVMLNKPRRKISSSGGKIFAFVGSDGSGKSSLIDQTYSSLNTQFLCKRLHFGKPLRFPPLRLFIVAVNSLFSLIKLNQCGIYFVALITASARYRVLRKAMVYRSRGYIVLLDRMYIPEIPSMDSPQILNGKYNLFSKIEKYYYDKIAKIELDDIVLLKVNTEIAIQRKPEESRNKIIQRVSEVNRYIETRSDLFIIDTVALSLDESVNAVLNNIWNKLFK